MLDLFTDNSATTYCQQIEKDVFLLKHFLLQDVSALLQQLAVVQQQAPARFMQTPAGHDMSAKITNCGHYGWVTDAAGYRYSERDPISQQPWPALPELFSSLATHAAAQVGFIDFVPDTCLINSYQPGAKMGLHQDKDEQDFSQPIVSFSLGLPVQFQMGGLKRADPKKRILLEHGDVLVWGRQKRQCFHGVLTLQPGEHPLLGQRRVNLTFRRAY